MAKKSAAKSVSATSVPAVPADDVVMTAVAKEAPAVKTTKPRNSSVPPKAKTAKTAANGKGDINTLAAIEVTNEMIAERAYHLWKSGAPGGEVDHWCAAERELNGK